MSQASPQHAARDTTDAYSGLVPSKESLDLLKLVEFSSFSEDVTTNIASGSETDDPFDSNDLIDLLSDHHLPVRISTPKAATPKAATPRAITPKALTPKAITLNAITPKATTPNAIKADSSTPIKHELHSLPQKLFVPESLSPFVTPQKPMKKPKLVFSSPLQVREFSTTAPKKDKSFRLNLPNPTIQLSTQRPFAVAGQMSAFDLPEMLIPETEKVVRPIVLSAEQEHVLQLASHGHSIFFTGSAGTGKSVLLRSIIKALKTKHGAGGVSVTASTGLAACNIGGITVHSFAGIGLGKGEAHELLKMVKKNRKALKRWCSTKVLVIDEVSMIDGKLFDKLDYIAQHARRNNKPFGGIQVIICGDFYQLPPVSRKVVKPDGSEHKEEALFAFECASWRSAISSTIILKEVFRQKGDQKFIDMLNDMRNGVVTPESEAEFNRLSRPLKCPEGIVPTELYATRYEVETANNVKLRSLPGESVVYESRDGGSLPVQARISMLSNFLAPSRLFLKVNAQVMCIKNYDETLVNGSLGQVIKFMDRDTYMCYDIMKNNPELSLEETKELLLREKVKFRLSHSQGEDVTDDQIDLAVEQLQSQPLLDSVFNFFYEDKSPQTEIPSSDAEELTMEQRIAINKVRKLEFIENLQLSSTGEKHPLVRFLNPDGVTTRDVLVEPERWEITNDDTEEVLASRVQLPLMLAWALSIHKSQGQTLQKVKVDLTRIFENGQAYVALSRAVARDGLQVLNFKRERVRTHRIVEQFYRTLTTAEKARGR